VALAELKIENSRAPKFGRESRPKTGSRIGEWGRQHPWAPRVACPTYTNPIGMKLLQTQWRQNSAALPVIGLSSEKHTRTNMHATHNKHEASRDTHARTGMPVHSNVLISPTLIR
jgi:hypothetical protein